MLIWRKLYFVSCLAAPLGWGLWVHNLLSLIFTMVIGVSLCRNSVMCEYWFWKTESYLLFLNVKVYFLTRWMLCAILQTLHVHEGILFSFLCEGIIYGWKLFDFNMSEEGLLILCSWCPRQRNLSDIQKLFKKLVCLMWM